ncbi:hypothetical protein POL68_16855 [Stigmatella sp. ncwal1]|uniref:Phage shock protein B n=1 Tax=Stigmatella ashevillensis TaxID=2995309 RepID=A0ABT5D932_9BACT|nr:hypothetical protein [Stigmatella ashevillena]MDC0710149.1 hypothetical protein [Stigmatella ashevillena]
METTEAITVVMIVGMTCGIPLLGLTLRFCIKPVLETFIRLRETQPSAAQVQLLSERVAYLERQLERQGLMERPIPTAVSVQPMASEPFSALAKKEPGRI